MSGSVVLMSKERRDVTCCASIKLVCVTASKLQMNGLLGMRSGGIKV